MFRLNNLLPMAAALASLAVLAGCTDKGTGPQQLPVTTKTFAVSFDANGGEPADIAPVTVDSGKTLGADYPVVTVWNEWYWFVGWFDVDGVEYTENTAITHDVTLKAKWDGGDVVHCITVYFNGNGYPQNPIYITEVINCQGDPIKLILPELTWEGHIFGGWFDEDGVEYTEYTSTTVFTKSVTLTAKWTIEGVEATRFTVIFDVNGGEPADIAPVVVDSGWMMGAQFPEAPTREGGRMFVGWYDGDKRYAASTIITGDVTLTAKWTPPPVFEQITIISFNANGGMPENISSKVGNGIGWAVGPLPVVTREGYDFVGWYDEGEDELYTESTLATKGVTLTARWVEIKD